jgi:hypothetical protein
LAVSLMRSIGLRRQDTDRPQVSHAMCLTYIHR